jgi:hypothetical protein
MVIHMGHLALEILCAGWLYRSEKLGQISDQRMSWLKGIRNCAIMKRDGGIVVLGDRGRVCVSS